MLGVWLYFSPTMTSEQSICCWNSYCLACSFHVSDMNFIKAYQRTWEWNLFLWRQKRKLLRLRHKYVSAPSSAIFWMDQYPLGCSFHFSSISINRPPANLYDIGSGINVQPGYSAQKDAETFFTWATDSFSLQTKRENDIISSSTMYTPAIIYLPGWNYIFLTALSQVKYQNLNDLPNSVYFKTN